MSESPSTMLAIASRCLDGLALSSRWAALRHFAAFEHAADLDGVGRRKASLRFCANVLRDVRVGAIGLCERGPDQKLVRQVAKSLDRQAQGSGNRKALSRLRARAERMPISTAERSTFRRMSSARDQVRYAIDAGLAADPKDAHVLAVLVGGVAADNADVAGVLPMTAAEMLVDYLLDAMTTTARRSSR